MKRLKSNGLPGFLALALATIIVGSLLGFGAAGSHALPVFSHDRSVSASPDSQTFYEFVRTFEQNTSLSDNSLRGISALIGLYCLIWCIAFLVKKTFQTRYLLTAIGFLVITFLAAGIISYGTAALMGALGLTHANARNPFHIPAIIAITSSLLFAHTATVYSKSKQTVLTGGMFIYCFLNTIFVFAQCHMAYLFSIPILSIFIYSILIRYNKKFISSTLLQAVYIALSGIIIIMIYTPVIHLLNNSHSYGMIMAAASFTVSSVLPVCIMAAACLTGKADSLPEEVPDTSDAEFYCFRFFNASGPATDTMQMENET